MGALLLQFLIILQIFRHPNHIQTNVFLWSHHEKIVVIDQTLAFVGGIDLCFGRYDDHCHCISDHGRPPPHLKSVTELAKAVTTVGSTEIEEFLDLVHVYLLESNRSSPVGVICTLPINCMEIIHCSHFFRKPSR